MKRHTLKRMARIARAGLFATFAAASYPALADSSFEVVPTAVRMEDYLNGALDLWYTPGTCTSGHVYLPASAPADSKNRLWSLILTAKAAGKVVGIFYDPTSCIITHFYSREN